MLSAPARGLERRPLRPATRRPGRRLWQRAKAIPGHSFAEYRGSHVWLVGHHAGTIGVKDGRAIPPNTEQRASPFSPHSPATAESGRRRRRTRPTCRGESSWARLAVRLVGFAIRTRAPNIPQGEWQHRHSTCCVTVLMSQAQVRVALSTTCPECARQFRGFGGHQGVCSSQRRRNP